MTKQKYKKQICWSNGKIWHYATMKKVIIFAWLNCKPKHLQKIASWWEAKNIKPITVYSPPQNLFFPYWLGRRAGAQTAKLLTDDGLGKDDQTFMHAFSGQASYCILVRRRSAPLLPPPSPANNTAAFRPHPPQ
jgi:hypothetical protein